MRLRTLAAATLVALVALPVAVADEVLKPTKAQSAFRKAMRKVPGAQKEAEAKRRSIEYLKAWEASGKTPTPTDKYALAQFRQSAGEPARAAAEFQAVQTDQGVKEKTRDYAASAEAALLLNATVRGAYGKEKLAGCAERLGKYAAAMAGNPGRAKSRTTLMKILAQVHAMGGNAKAAHDMRMQIINDDPKSLSSLAGPILQALTMNAGAATDERTTARRLRGHMSRHGASFAPHDGRAADPSCKVCARSWGRANERPRRRRYAAGIRAGGSACSR